MTKTKTKPKSRAHTAEECKRRLFERIAVIVDYCEKETRKETVRERLNLLVFSILAEIDGSGENLPLFQLIPDPHPDDKKFHRKQGENWWPEGMNLAGRLHDEWHEYERAE